MPRDTRPAWCCDNCAHAWRFVDPLWFDFFNAASDAGTIDERRLRDDR